MNLGKVVTIGDTLLNMEVTQILQGGMCQIFVCRDRFSTLIAVKMLRPELVERGKLVIDQFWREAEAWLLLGRHPNIVHAMEITFVNNQPAILMPYYERGSLENLIGSNLSTDDAITYAIHFCSGMIHAANTLPNFVHRDIKPGNCLIGSDNFLKLSDFGLVRAFDDGIQTTLGLMSVEEFLAATEQRQNWSYQSQKGSALGTRSYMPPEQFDDASQVDVRSDIYSFGALFYQMLSGRRPIEPERARSQKDWQEAHCNMPVPPLDESLPLPLRQLVYACLAKKPIDRPTTFTEILDELRLLRSLPTRPAIVTQSDLPEAVSVLLSEGTDLIRRSRNLVVIGRLQEALDYANHIVDLAENISHELDETVHKYILAHVYTSKGMVLSLMHRETEAFLCLEKALKYNPDNSQALYECGCLYNASGEFRKAIAVLERGYQLEPKRTSMANEYGLALNFVGDFEKAQSVLLEALQLDPSRYQIYRELGYCYLMRKRWQEAIDYYQTALALSPANDTHNRGEIMCNLGLIHFYLAREKGTLDTFDEISIWLNSGLKAIQGASFEKNIHNQLRKLGLLK